MSREIKFRVWDKDLKKMHICGENQHDSISFSYPENEAHYYNLQNGCGSSTDGSGTYELMQYTGLKDKNGKEIYEGDIINYSFTDCGEVNTRVLEVYNDGINFKTREIYRDYWLEKVGGILSIVHGQLNAHKGKTQYLTDISCSSIYSYEVISNIYENPELLEETA